MSISPNFVLVLTGHDDPMWPFLVDACSPQERERLILFPTNQPQLAQCSYDPIKQQAKLSVNGVIVSGEDIKSVWLRRLVMPDYVEFSKELQLYCMEEYRSFFEGLEYALPYAYWISRPSALSRARNKALQLSLAAQLGFVTSETWFSNTPNQMADMVCSGPTIYKSIVTPRVPLGDDRFASVFTTLLKQDDLSEANGLLSCPGILQRFCDKVADIRVSIFGNEIFAVHIDSQKLDQARLDFRAGALQVLHSVHDLPIQIKEQCRLLVAQLGLKFGAIDLALMADGSYVFFEINPNGQWGWLEELTRLPMRRALLDLLFGEHEVLSR